MYNTKTQPECKLCTLGDNNVSIEVHQLATDCNEYTILVEDTDNKKGYPYVRGQWVQEKSLFYLSISVSLELFQ